MALNSRGLGARLAIGLAVVAVAGAGTLAGASLSSGTPAPPDEPEGKAPANSSLSVTYVIAPADCNSSGRATAGTILKLIDVVAGIASRRHAGRRTVTVSVDRVIFLAPAHTNDLVHLSASVNRAWGTSMEIGVRVLAQDAKTGAMSYSCHAYLTFVAKPTPIASRLWGLLPAPPTPRPRIPPILPATLLEQKRFILAGRRRGARLQRKEVNDAILAGFRELVYQLVSPLSASVCEPAIPDSRLADIERDVLVDAFVAKDPDVRVDRDRVIYRQPGSETDTIVIPLAEVEKAAATKGRGRRLDLPRSRSLLVEDKDDHVVLTGSEAPLTLSDTLIMTAQLAMPNHANSQGVLFGGALLSWIEVNANASARSVFNAASWALVTLDGMTFKESVQIGETCTIRSVVVRTYGSWASAVRSAEVYSIVTADSLAAPTPRFVADALLVLVALDSSDNPIRDGRLRQIKVPDGPAADLAAGGDDRRASRRESRDLLLRVYGPS